MAGDSNGLGADLRSFETSILLSFFSIPIYWSIILQICTKWVAKEDPDFNPSNPKRKFEATPRLFICFIGILVTFLSSFFMFELMIATSLTVMVSLGIGSAAVTGFTMLFGNQNYFWNSFLI